MVLKVALGLAGLVVLGLAIAQLVLPAIAASTISSRIGRYGRVRSVQVSAWPAVKLLWGQVDSVKVRAGALRMSPSQSAKLLWEAHDTTRLYVSAESVQEGPLHLTNATLTKRGAQLGAQAHLSSVDARAALPPGIDVRLVDSREGRVKVQVGGGLFGVGAAVQAVAEPSRGELVAHPVGLLVSGLQLRLFSDSHVYVEGVGAREAGDGYDVTMNARLR